MRVICDLLNCERSDEGCHCVLAAGEGGCLEVGEAAAVVLAGQRQRRLSSHLCHRAIWVQRSRPRSDSLIKGWILNPAQADQHAGVRFSGSETDLNADSV